jgi:hypothetical protein
VLDGNRLGFDAESSRLYKWYGQLEELFGEEPERMLL